MSFVDLATLAMHRRAEMDARISVLTNKCEEAQNNLKKLKFQGLNLANQLNCDPSELKDRFLYCMKQLDEFIYMVTDFNLSFTTLAESSNHEQTPVLDVSNVQCLVPRQENLLDMLSNPLQARQTVCANQCKTQKPKIRKPPKENALIAFSSSSSQESVPEHNEAITNVERECDKSNQVIVERKCDVPVDNMNNLSLADSEGNSLIVEKWNLPAQSVLPLGFTYSGCIMHVDGNSLWVITDGIQLATNLMMEMTEFYHGKKSQMTREQVFSLSYCAYYDHESNCAYRCLLVNNEDDIVELFLVDTGEVHFAPIYVLQPLMKQFCLLPPFARCCYLSGVEVHDNELNLENLEKYLRSFQGQQICIEVDDNTSESLGVYISLKSDNTILNQLVIDYGFAVAIEKSVTSEHVENAASPLPPAAAETDTANNTAVTIQGPPEILPQEDFSMDSCPEYTDPVEAVTGYHNRDEIDICKHYKGGPNRTCFKGSRCKKKHIMKHPDGWTLDKVEVCGKARLMPLPQPGSWHYGIISCVPHYDHVFIQLHTNQNDHVTDEKRSFGVMLPPMTLSSLIRDMNSPATKVAMRPLKMAPAPGELVAANYPLDQNWYRALVLSLANHDQSVEVRFVDYGTDIWVKEDHIRELDMAYTVLPQQAIRCRLAGVKPKCNDPELWVRAKNVLQNLVLNKKVQCKIIVRHYDELEIELFDLEGNLIAQKLADLKLITLSDYSVLDDSDIQTKIVVP